MAEKQEKRSNDEGKLEQEARIALLQHFSSKSSNQVTNALTIALVFFAFIAALDALKSFIGNWLPLFFGLTIVFLFALAVHTVNRLLYWGTLASYVLKSSLVPESFNQRKREESNEYDLRKQYEKYKKKHKNSSFFRTDFRKSFDEQHIRCGELPLQDCDFNSPSLCMERLSKGCLRDLEQSNWDNWRKLTMLSGFFKDPMFAALGASLLFLGIYVNQFNMIAIFIMAEYIGVSLLFYWSYIYFRFRGSLRDTFSLTQRTPSRLSLSFNNLNGFKAGLIKFISSFVVISIIVFLIVIALRPELATNPVNALRIS